MTVKEKSGMTDSKEQGIIVRRSFYSTLMNNFSLMNLENFKKANLGTSMYMEDASKTNEEIEYPEIPKEI